MTYSNDHVIKLFDELHEAWHVLRQAMLALPSSDTQYRLSAHAKEGAQAAVLQDLTAMRTAFRWIETILQKDYAGNAIEEVMEAIRHLLDELLACLKLAQYAEH